LHGVQTAPPTDSINSLHYDILNDSPRELVQKDGIVWVRSYNCSTNTWGSWSTVSLDQAWGQNEGEGNNRLIPECGFYCNPPPLNGNFSYFAANYLDSKFAEEIVVQNDYVWSRRSENKFLDTINISQFWRITQTDIFFQRYRSDLSIVEYARGYIDDYLYIYEYTNFAPVLQNLINQN